MEASQKPKTRRRFNESRIIRLPSLQELGEGQVLHVRPLLPLVPYRVERGEKLTQMRRAAVASALLSVAFILLAFAGSEIAFADSDSDFSDAAKGVGVALACTQVGLSVVHYKATLRIKQLRGLVFEGSTHYAANLVFHSTCAWLAAEAAVLLCVVPPFLHADGRELGHLLVTLSFLRAFLLYRVWFTFSSMMEAREAFFWCAPNSELHTLKRSRFILRCLLKDHPRVFLLLTISAMCVLSGMLLREYERPGIRSLYDSLWLAAISQCTIGYGDVIVHTYFGKAVCMGVSFLGCVTISLMINIMQNSAGLSVKEKMFLNEVHSTSKVRSRLKPLATVLLQKWWRFRLAQKNGSRYFLRYRRFMTTVKRFRLQQRLLVSKEVPEVDELIHRVQESIGAQFQGCNSALVPLKKHTADLASLSTSLSRFTVAILGIRRQAMRLKVVPSLSKSGPTKISRFTWATRAFEVSKVAKKRSTEKAYRRVLGFLRDRDSSPLSQGFDFRESVSTSAQES